MFHSLIPWAHLRSALFAGLYVMVVTVAAQTAVVPLPDAWRSVYRPVHAYGNSAGNSLSTRNWPQELGIGTTYYDRQSEYSSPPNRLAIFPEGKLAVVWTRSEDSLDTSEPGTAYTWFDGSIWLPQQGRVEAVPALDPSIALLNNGEAIVSAPLEPGPLLLNKRPGAGNGVWQESQLPLPPGIPGIVTPRLVSSGLGNSVLHILGLSLPVASGGSSYHGLDGALLYYRSQDAGQSWDQQAVLVPGLDSVSYNGFTPGCFSMAEPRGNQLAFVVADPWSDLVVMKSNNGGTSWQKTVLWEHPYPQWNGEATDSIYCPDGSVHLAFDHAGTLHVVFGLTRLFSDGSQVYRFPYIGGIAHWKEGNPVWTGGSLQNMLNPDSLEAQGRLVCNYLQDWNNNGIIDLLGNFGEYGTGPCSFPQIAFDAQGIGMLLLTSVTEGRNNGVQDYRQLWYKYFFMGEPGNIIFNWMDQPLHISHEAAYPSIGAFSPDYLGWPLVYQVDSEPGTAMGADADPVMLNSIQKVDLKYMAPPINITVQLTADPPGGGVVSGGGTYPNGSSVTINAEAYPGLEFVNWTSQNVVFSVNPEVTFQAVWNYNLVAHFRLLPGIGEATALPHLFPNPATHEISIDPGRPGIKEIRMADVFGKQWKPEYIEEDSGYRVLVNKLPGGIYFLELLLSDGKWVRKKFIKT